MGSNGPSWADQWGAIEEEKTASEKKESRGTGKKMADVKAAASAGLDKAKAAATSGAQKMKSGTSVGLRWVKSHCQKKSSSK